MDCLFCKIINGDIPSKKVYEDEFVLAFEDISPMAKVHILIIPKIHISSSAEITAENSDYISKIFEVVAKLSKELNLKEGFRVVTNCGEHGCQSVNHLHFHLLGGEQLNPNLA